MTAISLPPARRNGLLMLALIVSLLALPFAIAAGLYFGGWKPARTNHHGQLLEPPLAIPASGLLTADGKPLQTSELQGKWLLLMSINGPCGAQCIGRIDEMRRIQVSLNKEMGRLRRVTLSTMPSDPELAAAGQQQPDLLILGGPKDWLGTQAVNTGYHLHIIDPLGKRIMDYPAEASAREIRADLERLLKFAWTG
jgi:hypothetical protein